MIKKYKITYRAVCKHLTMEIEAYSKYDAKQRFYRLHPEYDVISVKEVQADKGKDS